MTQIPKKLLFLLKVVKKCHETIESVNFLLKRISNYDQNCPKNSYPLGVV